MHVWQWIISGLVAGLLARFAMPQARLGLAADLALGSLGALATGALLRFAGFTQPGPGLVHVVVALIGAIGLIGAIHGFARATAHAGRLVGSAMKPRDLDSRLASLNPEERRVFRKFLSREPVARDLSGEMAQAETFSLRMADRIASFGGSWAFIGLSTAVLVTWMLFNIEARRPFDPYPFILLNLVLSCLAAMQAPIILMSQNRQADKDRLHAQADYEVNLKAEMEILTLHEKLDALREKAWQELIAQQERQLELLTELQRASQSSASDTRPGPA